jgi:hypothetical protein
MLTKIESRADFERLPSSIKHALAQRPNISGARFKANIIKAERKQALHRTVAAAVKEGQISLALGIEILETNNAYGPQGKAVLAHLST